MSTIATVTPVKCIQLFIRRFFSILTINRGSSTSPTALIVGICRKYKIIRMAKDMMLTGIIPSKSSWARMCKRLLLDHQFSRWRLSLKFYRKLSYFRIICTQIEMNAWWTLSRYNICLKYACSIMLKIISGCSLLRLDRDTNIPRDERICLMCNVNSVEDAYHVVMECSYYDDIRTTLFIDLERHLSSVTFKHFIELPIMIRFYILMGMDYTSRFVDSLQICEHYHVKQ